MTVFRLIVLLSCVAFTPLSGASAQEFWPPVVGQPYPDFELVDQQGRTVKISDFKGDVLFVEYVGMNCPACQAFSGGHDEGAYENNTLQQNLSSIEKYFPQYTGGLTLPSDGMVFIQILLYDMKLGQPGQVDAAKWAEHFGFLIQDNQYVLVPKKDLRGNASYNLIPGFQLVDRNFILRSDSTGHHPKDDLYKKLLPMVPELLK